MVLEVDDDLLVLLAEEVGRLLALQVHILEELAELEKFRVPLLVDLELRVGTAEVRLRF